MDKPITVKNCKQLLVWRDGQKIELDMIVHYDHHTLNLPNMTEAIGAFSKDNGLTWEFNFKDKTDISNWDEEELINWENSKQYKEEHEIQREITNWLNKNWKFNSNEGIEGVVVKHLN